MAAVVTQSRNSQYAGVTETTFIGNLRSGVTNNEVFPTSRGPMPIQKKHRGPGKPEGPSSAAEPLGPWGLGRGGGGGDFLVPALSLGMGRAPS